MKELRPPISRFPNMLSAALAYAARGWSVFPVHTPSGNTCSCRRPDCEHIGKHPRTGNGKNDATTDESIIKHWWSQWPDANIGLWCRDIVVIDVDPRNGGARSLELLFETKADKNGFSTLEAITGGGGKHYVFAAPDFPVTISGIAPGIDIKAGGGYIVVAPSLHHSGGRYKWLDEDVEPAPMPDWLIAEIKNRSLVASPVELLEDIPEGRRNDTLYKLACSLRANKNLKTDEILDAVLAKNKRLCDALNAKANLDR